MSRRVRAVSPSSPANNPGARRVTPQRPAAKRARGRVHGAAALGPGRANGAQAWGLLFQEVAVEVGPGPRAAHSPSRSSRSSRSGLRTTGSCRRADWRRTSGGCVSL